MPRALAALTPMKPRGASPSTTCGRVAATLASSLAADAILLFTVRLRDGVEQLYATRVSKEGGKGSKGVTLRMGVPTTPHAQASPYPTGRAAECVELELGEAGCKLQYLQTHAKYFLPGHFDDPLAGLPLKRCTQPRMEEGAAPWGKVWLEVTRLLCLRLGIMHLDLDDESSVATPGGQLIALARIKLLTEGVTWYERVLHAAPASPREAKGYASSKARLFTLTMGDVTNGLLSTTLAALAALDGKGQVRRGDLIAGPGGVAARAIAAATTHHAGVMRVLSGPAWRLDLAENCNHNNKSTAVSTFLGTLLQRLKVMDPYGMTWRCDLAKTRPITEGVVLHGYVPAAEARDLLVR